MKVAIVSTGIANIASVRAAFHRLEIESVVTSDPELVRSSSHVMLPGVGAFGPGMQTLQEHELVESIRERVGAEKPLMAICLGIQILRQSSEESPGAVGLAIHGGAARRFSHEVRVPHFGWNEVVPDREMQFVSRGFAYFANSFRVVDVPAGWKAAITNYDGAFCSALERGNTLACQFHPELSGPFGLEIMRRWTSC